MQSLLCVALLVTGSLAIPASEPVYQGQLVTAQAVQSPQYQQPQYQQVQYQPAPQPQYQLQYQQPVQYKQVSQAEFLAAYAQQTPQVHEQQQDSQVQYQAQPVQYRNTQPLLGTVDRQIQKAAQHVAGPLYASQIANLQLQERQVQAQAQVQRNALRVATAPRAQPLQYQRALQQQQPRLTHQQLAEQGELPEQQYNSNPSYQFGFDVKDDLYTNYQNRKEQRQGDKITGSYSVVDADGYIRTVKYTADPKEGFKADVQREPTNIVVKFPTPQPPAQRTHQPAPQIQYRQPQYIEVPASSGSSQAQDEKPQYVYQYQ